MDLKELPTQGFSNWHRSTWGKKKAKYNEKSNFYQRITNQILTLFRMGGKKPPPLPPQFFPCNFCKCKNWPPKLSDWLLVLTLLTDWCKIASLYLVPVPNYWTSTKTTNSPVKKQFFWSNPYKIDVTITSLIQILEFPNFGHMTTSTI